MSIPPPNFDDLRQSFLSNLSTFRRSLKFLPDNEDLKTAVQIIKDIEGEYKASDYLINEDRLDSLSFKTAGKIDEVSQLIFPALSSDSKVGVEQTLDSLKSEVYSFKEIVAHREELDKEGLEPFLSEYWAKPEFSKLIASNHPWAVAKLKEMLEDNQASAFELLANMGPHKHHLISILRLYGEHPKLRSLIEKWVDGDDVQKSSACWVMESILQQDDCSWISRVIIERLDNSENYLIHQLYRKLVWDKMGQYSWLQDTVVENFEESKPWAVTFVYSYFYEAPNPACKEFMKVVLKRARHRPDLQVTLAAFSVLLGYQNPFYNFMIEISKEFRDLRSGFGSSFSSQLERLDWSRIDLDFSLSEGESNGRDFQWVNCALIFRINILKLLLQSEQNLIRALTGKADRAEFVDPPTSKCFPVVQSVMVGDLRTNVNGLDIILLDLASILQPHGITLYCPSSFEAPIDDHPNIKFIGTSQEQSLWLQDSHFIHEGGNRYPCLRIDEPRYSTCILEERRWRMLSEGEAVEEAASDLRSLVDSSPFWVMGSVGDEHAQFSFLEAMMTMDLRAAHQAILFTYNEGGNCLIGEFEGKRYAIIGKDVLGLNKKLMAERLSKIGLNKNSDGNWVVGSPYDEMDCRIDDDDIKLLVSLDMGLESPELCFFVEQPDYHLDMGMVILKDKRVLLNDSLESVRDLKRYLEQEIKDGRVTKKDRAVIIERANKFKREAFERKIYEDMAARDLKDQGFEVVRVAGVFKDITKPHPENHQVNFFNFLSLTTPDGNKVIIALGCNEFFEKRFRKIISENLLDVDEVRLLNQEASESLLLLNGGVHCMTKLSGKVPEIVV